MRFNGDVRAFSGVFNVCAQLDDEMLGYRADFICGATLVSCAIGQLLDRQIGFAVRTYDFVVLMANMESIICIITDSLNPLF